MNDRIPPEGRAPRPPSRGLLLAIMVGGFLAATAIFLLAILPAEFHIDPTGVGKASGLMSLSAPRADKVLASPAAPGASLPEASLPSQASSSTLRFYDKAYRSDVIDIPLQSNDKGPEVSELEYKVRMKTGDPLLYSWTVTGLPNAEEFYYDFHGETPPTPNNPQGRVVEYKQAIGTQSHGLLIAPLAGVHGWYLQNQSARPVVVHLNLSGLYELVPPGEYGNSARIQPNAVKESAK